MMYASYVAMRRQAIAYALVSAALFGASTPFAKLLLGELPPLLLAALLYLGSGLGLLGWIGLRRVLKSAQRAPSLVSSDYLWLSAAIGAGGVIAPVLLVFGLVRTEAATASLLLNLEAVLTAAIAWVAFRENVDRRVLAGMAAIVAGGVVLAWQEVPRGGGIVGPALIAGACLAWALDNNLTRRISGGDAAVIACLKGLVAGSVNLVLALQLGTSTSIPSAGVIAGACLVGFVGYGISLVFFIFALRDLGTARTGAYFSVAPFFGAALALLLLSEQATMYFWVAAALMAIGVRLHLSERHEHEHAHEPLEHGHMHVHDEHHQHAHDRHWNGEEPHAHAHRHGRMAHSHPHYPDLHHRHEH